jgi:hypothetical protein
MTGLLEAVLAGELRKATADDQAAWATTVVPMMPPKDAPPVARQAPVQPPLPRLANAYVVLKAFRFPVALYGNDAATFLIPKGVPAPIGNPGHSTVWDFNTGLCSGLMCNAGSGGIVLEIEVNSKGVRVQELN